MNLFELIAIIPARGGSKRLPRKNLINILGKPLLSYPIETARRWGKFDRIMVNSDDNEILHVGQECGAEIYRRPTNLADDKTKVLEVVQNQIKSMKLNKGNNIVFVMLPTCPLLSKEDLDQAFQLFIGADCRNAVVSVTEYEKPSEQALIIDQQGRLSPKYPDRYSSKSQDHEPVYRYNTAILINTAQGILEQTDIIGDNSLAYNMPFERSIDIDYEYHVRIIEALLLSSSIKQNPCME